MRYFVGYGFCGFIFGICRGVWYFLGFRKEWEGSYFFSICVYSRCFVLVEEFVSRFRGGLELGRWTLVRLSVIFILVF